MALFDHDIDETLPRYAIDKLHPLNEDTLVLFNKHLSMYLDFARFWAPRLEVAKKCKRYRRRDIFTRGQRAKYMNAQDKWPIEPQEMRQVIDPLVDQIVKRVPGGRVVMDDAAPPPTTANPEAMDMVLQWWDRILDLIPKRERALREGLLTGYPQCLWFSKEPVLGGRPGGLQATLLPGDSVLPSMFFEEPDGSDIEEMFRVSFRTKAELLERFPEREDALAEHEQAIQQDPGRFSQLLNSQLSETADDRKDLIFNMVMEQKLQQMQGYYLTVEHFFPAKKGRRVYYNERTEHAVSLPDEWSREKKAFWEKAHPDYAQQYTDKVRTLWTTTFSTDGFIWDNNAHWFQKNGKLPARWYIADMVDNLPTGLGEDLLPYVLLIAVCATEGLNQVRKGTGMVTHIEEGAVKNPSRITRELNKDDGVIIYKKGHKPGESMRTEQRKPNPVFMDVEDRYRAQMKEVHAVNDALRGATHPRQSDVAKSSEAIAGLSSQGQYVRNYTRFCLGTAQILCEMIPYCLTEETIVEIEDEFGSKKKPLVINQKGWDYSGQAQIIAMDVTSCDYRVVPVVGDDSATTREQQLREFADLLRAVGNQLFKLSPRLLGGILVSWPNRYAREAGMWLIEHADFMDQQAAAAQQAEQAFDMEKQNRRTMVELEKVNKPNINFKISPQDIEEAPNGARLLMSILGEMNRPKPAAAPQPQPQQQQPEQPTEAQPAAQAVA